MAKTDSTQPKGSLGATQREQPPAKRDDRCDIALDAVNEMVFLLENLTRPAVYLSYADEQEASAMITAVIVRGRQLLNVAIAMLGDESAPIAGHRNIVRYGSDEACYVPEADEVQP